MDLDVGVATAHRNARQPVTKVWAITAVIWVLLAVGNALWSEHLWIAALYGAAAAWNDIKSVSEPGRWDEDRTLSVRTRQGIDLRTQVPVASRADLVACANAHRDARTQALQ